jgi:hypothetical protein
VVQRVSGHGLPIAEPMMLADLAGIDPNHFFESASYYAGKNGVALWGQPTGSAMRRRRRASA